MFDLYVYLMYNVCMIRINIYITQKQKQALEELNGLTLSEHIRRAIDEYLAKLRKGKE